MNAKPDRATPPSRTRVLQILEATTGGTRRHLVDLCTNLDPQRFEVSVLCSDLRDPRFKDDIEVLRARGIEVVVVPMQREIHLVRDLRALAAIRRHLCEHPYDIVHAHSSKAGFLGRLAARQTHVPAIIYTPHGFAFQMDVSPLRRQVYLALERVATRWTDQLICVSAAELKAAKEHGLSRHTDVTLIPNGIRMPRPSPSQPGRRKLREQLGIGDSNRVVGAVGRLTEQKGYHDFVLAARLVRQQHEGVRFVLVGGGAQQAALESLVHSLDLEGCFQFIGEVGDPAMYYAAFDIFVAPSLWEGLPYTILDAMAHSLPVVATAVGGNPELVQEGQTGVLVPPHEPMGLATAINALLGDPQRCRACGERGNARVRSEYPIEKMVTQTEALYESRHPTA